jgi:hypothetical protein
MSSASILELISSVERMLTPSRRASALGLALKTWLVSLAEGRTVMDDEALQLALRLVAETGEALVAKSATVEAGRFLRTDYDELVRNAGCLMFYRLGCRWYSDALSEAPFLWRYDEEVDSALLPILQQYRRVLAGASQWMLRLATSRSFAEQVKRLPADELQAYRDRCAELASRLATSYGDLLFEQEQVRNPGGDLHRLVDDLSYFRMLGQLEAGSKTLSVDRSAAEMPATAVVVYHLVVAPSEYVPSRGVVICGRRRMLFCCAAPIAEASEPDFKIDLAAAFDDRDVQEAFLVDFTRSPHPLEFDVDPDGRWHWSRCPTFVESPRFTGRGATVFWGGLEYSTQPRLQVDEAERRVFSTKKPVTLLAEYPNVPSEFSAPAGRPTPLVFSHFDRWSLTDLGRRRDIRVDFHAGYATRGEFLSQDTAQIEVLHLATHGEVFPQQPFWANLCFSPENGYPSRVHFADLLATDWSATSLVFLNCCLSEMGRVAHGDERLSLAWAFLAGGARAVIAHRWPIRDTAACMFAEHFYDLWLDRESDVPLREAFQKSVQLLRRQTPDSAERNWASFVLLENAWKT